MNPRTTATCAIRREALRRANIASAVLNVTMADFLAEAVETTIRVKGLEGVVNTAIACQVHNGSQGTQPQGRG